MTSLYKNILCENNFLCVQHVHPSWHMFNITYDMFSVDMQQLHQRGALSATHALRTPAPKEDSDDGEQPQCLYKVGAKCHSFSRNSKTTISFFSQ